MAFLKTLATFFWNRDLDEMLTSLGVAPVSEVLSSLSSMNSVASDASTNATPDGSLQPISLNGAAPIRVKKSTTSLSVVSVQATDIPPRETVTYTKQTQTTTTGGVERDGGYLSYSNCRVFLSVTLSLDLPFHLTHHRFFLLVFSLIWILPHRLWNDSINQPSLSYFILNFSRISPPPLCLHKHNTPLQSGYNHSTHPPWTLHALQSSTHLH